MASRGKKKRENSSLVAWVERELNMLHKDKDGMQDAMNKCIMDIVEVFDKQGHSGFSASYVISAIHRLLAWKPLTPLTGADEEWEKTSTPGLEQNRRYTSVFRENGDNATAYDTKGKIFSDNGGITWFTSKESHVPITFPYTVPERPQQVYLDKDRNDISDQPEKIKELREQTEARFNKVY